MIVTVGQAVDFLNDEDRLIEHNVFSNSPAKRFDLGLYRPGRIESCDIRQARVRSPILLDSPATWTA